MLTTILSDMGNVLIRYEPETFLKRRGIEQAQDRELLLQEVFYSPLWSKLDMGELDEAGLEEQLLPRLPEKFRSLAHDLIFHWDEPILPMPGMAELLQECKSAGLGLYLLSNASQRQPTYWPRIPGSSLFDGGIVSAFFHCCKPSPEIYKIALDQFHLSPEECLFVDDMEPNVRGAEAVGIPAFQFTGDVSSLRRHMESLGIVFPR